MSPIATDAAASPMLSRLMASLSAIVQRMPDERAWRGAWLGSADSGYLRIEATDTLVSAGNNPREYSVAVHVFDRPGASDLHDHRWPMAVYPFGSFVPYGALLYEMPWEAGADTGTHLVRSQQPYAIDDPHVRHAVRPVRPHLSVMIADISGPPIRPARLSAVVVPDEITRAGLRAARDALAAGWGH